MSTDSWLFLFALVGALGAAATVLDVVVKLLNPSKKDPKSKRSDSAQVVVSRNKAWLFVLLWFLCTTLSSIGFYRSFATTAPSNRPLLKAWGSNDPLCLGTLDTWALMEYREKYNVAVICGFIDPTTDQFEDRRITTTPFFTIRAGDLEFVSPFSVEMMDTLNKAKEEASKHGPVSKGTKVRVEVSVWYKVVIVPKGVATSEIHKLSDVQRYGGKVLN